MRLRGGLGRAAIGDRHLGGRPVPGDPERRHRRRRGTSSAARSRSGSLLLRGVHRACDLVTARRSAGRSCSRRSATVPLPRLARLAARRATSRTTSCRRAWARSCAATTWASGRASAGRRSSARSSWNALWTRIVVVVIAAIAILVLSVRGIVASAVLVGLAVSGLLVVAIALGLAAHRLPGADRAAAWFIGRWPRVHGTAGPAADGALDRQRRPRDGDRRRRALGRVVVVHGPRLRRSRPGRRHRADDRPGGAPGSGRQPRDSRPGRARLRRHLSSWRRSRSPPRSASTASPPWRSPCSSTWSRSC